VGFKQALYYLLETENPVTNAAALKQFNNEE